MHMCIALHLMKKVPPFGVHARSLEVDPELYDVTVENFGGTFFINHIPTFRAGSAKVLHNDSLSLPVSQSPTVTYNFPLA